MNLPELKVKPNKVIWRDNPYELIESDLSGFHATIWEALRAGAAKNNVFHSPVLSTFGEEYPEARTVVLRKAEELQQQLWFHTDVRSPKWKQLALNNKVSWLFYDSEQKIQLRAYGEAQLNFDNAVTKLQWNNAWKESKKCYSAFDAPGTEIPLPDNGLPDVFLKNNYDNSLLESGYKNFGVVITSIERIDCLLLKYNAHRRVRIKYSPDKVNPEFYWLQP
jgi:hypothetical protein